MVPKFIGKAKLSKQGQITLPYEARDDLGIDLNSEIYWYEVDDYLIAMKELINPKDLAIKLNKKRSKK
jgi:bifunctional DNA-binding transcriptional regulator/antitoxin component of YhaV-PrlF toxin-antitoxin module|tara:strand:+ start:2344 stop:2547 length:204 start_codon:yes stop_codon:yes gene_type:complete